MNLTDNKKVACNCNCEKCELRRMHIKVAISEFGFSMLMLISLNH